MSQPRKQIRFAKPFALTFLGVLTLLSGLYLGTLIGYALLVNSDYIFTGVHAGTTDLSTQTQAEAMATLTAEWSAQQVQVVAGDDAWEMPATELGFQLDAEQTVETAHAQGRDLWQTPWRVLQLDTSLSPQMTVDWETTQNALTEFAATAYIEPVDATLVVENGSIVTTPAQIGRNLDIAQTITAWQAEWEAGLDQLPLITIPVTPSVSDVSQLADEANAILARPFTLSGYDPIVDEVVMIDVSAETRHSWLQFNIDNNTLQTTIDTAAVATFISDYNASHDRTIAPTTTDTIAQAILAGDPQLEVRLYHPISTYTVEAGDSLSSIGRKVGIPYPWLQAANPTLDTLRVGQTITIPSPDALLPLPVVRNKRIVISISEQRLWAYENGDLQWEWAISTGIADSPTAPGVFQVQTHELEAYASLWDLHMPYFMGIYQPAPNIDFFNGFHGFPTRDGVNLLWTNSLGKPATYGCVLVDNQLIPTLYEWAETGTIVEINS